MPPGRVIRGPIPGRVLPCPFFTVSLSQLSIKFGINFNDVNRAVLRAVNSGAARRDGLTVDSTSARRTSSPSSPGAPDVLEQGGAPRILLTSQDGVHIGSAVGDDHCVVLRYAFGGGVSILEGWASIVDRTREVMAHDLGHVHFCQCFS